MLIGCGGDSGDSDPGSTTTYEDPCLEDYYAELTRCTDISCAGCVDWECLFCGGECRYSAETVYNACCSASYCADYAPYHIVSGHVKTEDGSGLADVQVSLSGASSGTQYTDQDGYYRISNVSDGLSTLTPSLSGYCFDPESYSFNLYPFGATEYSNYHFTALQACYTISGQITNPDGSPLPGVVVELSGSASTTTTTTASNGYYTFSALYSGAYTVAPDKFGSTPLNRAVTVELADVAGQDFVMTGRAISGTLATTDGSVLPGVVTINLTGPTTASTSVDANGAYAFTGLDSGGSYTITPSSTCTAYTFDRDFIALELLDADVSGQDFVAAVTPFGISGSVTAYGAPLSGATLTRNGTGTTSTICDAAGLYSFSGVEGSLEYTLTPSAPRYAFYPPSRSLPACNLTVAQQDFIGATSWFRVYDYFRSSKITLSSDGGYVIAGGYSKLAVLKLDSGGNAVWKKTYWGGHADAIEQTSDGGYIVAGGWGDNFLVMKLSGSGETLWQKTYDVAARDHAYAIQETSDGGYIVAGFTLADIASGNSDVLILKLDSGGNILWQKQYGGTGDDVAYSVRQTSDGGYIVAGQSDSFGAGSYDFMVMKLTSDGDILWQKTYGGSGRDYPSSIRESADGGFIVAGNTISFGAGSYDAWVLKLDSNGNILWQKAYGERYIDHANSVRETADGGYLVAGLFTIPLTVGSYTPWFLRLDTNGDLLWQKTYGDLVHGVHSIEETSDGGFIASGNYKPTGLAGIEIVFKTDADGNIDYCNMDQTSEAITSDTNISPASSSATVLDTIATASDITITVEDASTNATQTCPAL